MPWARCKAVEETRVRVCGQVWEVSDQSLHEFWIDMEHAPGVKVSWTLHYDMDRARLSRRSSRDALHLIRDPAEVPWKVTLTSDA